MKIDIIPIGNSRGIRIPKSLLEQCGFADSADLEIRDRQIVLSPVGAARASWGVAFKAMAASGDDAPLGMPSSNAFDEDEWQW